MAAIEFLQMGVEQYLRELPDDEFEALTARVRPPKSARYPAKRNGKRRSTSSGEH